MKFTIEVKKIKENSDCSIANLKLYHKECHGGKIKLKKDSEFIERCVVKRKIFNRFLRISLRRKECYITLATTWHLDCNNCGANIKILSDPSAIKILDTAIDGKERKIGEDTKIMQIQ
jgi:hypothetical protein